MDGEYVAFGNKNVGTYEAFGGQHTTNSMPAEHAAQLNHKIATTSAARLNPASRPLANELDPAYAAVDYSSMVAPVGDATYEDAGTRLDYEILHTSQARIASPASRPQAIGPEALYAAVDYSGVSKPARDATHEDAAAQAFRKDMLERTMEFREDDGLHLIINGVRRTNQLAKNADSSGASPKPIAPSVYEYEAFEMSNDDFLGPVRATHKGKGNVERPTHAVVGQTLHDKLVSLWGNVLTLALFEAGSRDKPSSKGAWVNYDAGMSEGRGDGGLYFTADGHWNHDEVYAQNVNPALEKVVGTRKDPTAHIFDYTQGTVGNEGQSEEGTGEQQARYRRNQAQDQLNEVYSESREREVRFC